MRFRGSDGPYFDVGYVRGDGRFDARRASPLRPARERDQQTALVSVIAASEDAADVTDVPGPCKTEGRAVARGLGSGQHFPVAPEPSSRSRASLDGRRSVVGESRAASPGEPWQVNTHLPGVPAVDEGTSWSATCRSAPRPGRSRTWCSLPAAGVPTQRAHHVASAASHGHKASPNPPSYQKSLLAQSPKTMG